MKSHFVYDVLVILTVLVLSALIGLARNAALGSRAAWTMLPAQQTSHTTASPRDIAFHELAAGLRDARFVLLDARGADTYRSGHIPGARNLPVAADEETMHRTMHDLRADPRPVVVYCSGVLCEDADELAARLHALDPSKPIFIYRGGWEEWRANGH